MHATCSVVLLVLLAVGCSRPPKAHYTFALPSAAGLRAKAPITFKGVPVGYIDGIRLAAQGSNGAAGVIATGYITDPQMHLLAGDTARIVTVALLANPQIEIVRSTDAGSLLPVGSTVMVASPPSALTVFTGLLEAASEMRDLPPDKQKRVADQIRAVIATAKADCSNGPPVDSK